MDIPEMVKIQGRLVHVIVSPRGYIDVGETRSPSKIDNAVEGEARRVAYEELFRVTLDLERKRVKEEQRRRS